jgi:alginate O-acetyltransferase complex protein AlgI
MITMLLGGLWHGANWTFIAWGSLHGLYLIINHIWIDLSKRHKPLGNFRSSVAGRIFGHGLTFLAVTIAWVLFRSPTFDIALNILGGMFGFHGATLPVGFAFALGPVRVLTSMLGITFANLSGWEFARMYAWVAALLSVAFLAPNTQQLMARYEPVLEMARGRVSDQLGDALQRKHRLAWSPSVGWAIATGLLAFLSVASVARTSEFLYWQF